MQKDFWNDPIFKPFFDSIRTGNASVQPTGAGEDGVIQPLNPVGTISTNEGPKMLHEGELTVTTPDGRFAVIPSSSLPQSVLREMEKQSKMGGFASGGTGVLAKTDQTQKSNLNIQPIGETSKDAVTGILPQQPQNGLGLGLQPIGTTSQSVINNVIPQPPQSGFRLQPIGQPAQIKKSDEELSTDIIRGYATGNNPYLREITNTMEQNLGAAGAAGSAAMKQELAMAGADEGQIQTAIAAKTRDNESQLSKAEAEINKQALSQQLGAANTLNTISTAKNQTEYERAKAEEEKNYQRQITAATTAFNAGDIEGGAKIFSSLYPSAKIDFSKLVSEQKQQDFADGVSVIDEYSTSSMTFDQLNPIFKMNGVYEKTGLTESQVKGMLEDSRLRTNPLTSSIAAMTDTAISTILPDLPQEKYSAFRSAMGKFVLMGGVTYDSDGKPIMNYELLKNDQGLAELLGLNTETSKEATYENYKQAMTEGGKIPLSEAAWIGAGKPAANVAGAASTATTTGGDVPIGRVDDPASVATVLKSKGLNISEDDAQAFITDMGRVPNSVEEFQQWDLGRGNMAFWNNIEDKTSDLPKGTLVKDGKPVLDASEIKGIISKAATGDKTAMSYVVGDNTADGKNISSILSGKMTLTSLDALRSNIGKIVGGKYIIQSGSDMNSGNSNRITQIELYDINTGETRTIRYMRPKLTDNGEIIFDSARILM